MADPAFTTREEFEAWEADEHAFIAKFDDPFFVAGALSIIARVKRNHAHLLTPESDNG